MGSSCRELEPGKITEFSPFISIQEENDKLHGRQRVRTAMVPRKMLADVMLTLVRNWRKGRCVMDTERGLGVMESEEAKAELVKMGREGASELKAEGLQGPMAGEDNVMGGARGLVYTFGALVD
jgi:hypothetical protein